VATHNLKPSASTSQSRDTIDSNTRQDDESTRLKATATDRTSTSRNTTQPQSSSVSHNKLGDISNFPNKSTTQAKPPVQEEQQRVSQTGGSPASSPTNKDHGQTENTISSDKTRCIHCSNVKKGDAVLQQENDDYRTANATLTQHLQAAEKFNQQLQHELHTARQQWQQQEQDWSAKAAELQRQLQRSETSKRQARLQQIVDIETIHKLNLRTEQQQERYSELQQIVTPILSLLQMMDSMKDIQAKLEHHVKVPSLTLLEKVTNDTNSNGKKSTQLDEAAKINNNNDNALRDLEMDHPTTHLTSKNVTHGFQPNFDLQPFSQNETSNAYSVAVALSNNKTSSDSHPLTEKINSQATPSVHLTDSAVSAPSPMNSINFKNPSGGKELTEEKMAVASDTDQPTKTSSPSTRASAEGGTKEATSDNTIIDLPPADAEIISQQGDVKNEPVRDDHTIATKDADAEKSKHDDSWKASAMKKDTGGSAPEHSSSIYPARAKKNGSSRSSSPAEQECLLWDDEGDITTRSKSRQTKLTCFKTKESPSSIKISKSCKPVKKNEPEWLDTRKPQPTKKQTFMACFMTPKETKKNSKENASSRTEQINQKKRKRSDSPETTTVPIKKSNQNSKQSRFGPATLNDSSFEDSQESILQASSAKRANRVSLSATKASKPETFHKTPPNKTRSSSPAPSLLSLPKSSTSLTKEEKKSKSNIANVVSDTPLEASKVGADSSSKPPIKTTRPANKKIMDKSAHAANQKPLQLFVKPVSETHTNENRFTAPPEATHRLVAPSSQSKHPSIDEIVACPYSTQMETQLTTRSGHFFGGNTDSLSDRMLRVAQPRLSLGSEFQPETPSPPTATKPAAKVPTLTQPQCLEKETELSKSSEMHLEPTSRSQRESAAASSTSTQQTPEKATQLSEGSETQWEKTQTEKVVTLSPKEVNKASFQKPSLSYESAPPGSAFSQESSTQWDNPDSLLEKRSAPRRFSLADAEQSYDQKGSSAPRGVQSQVRLALAEDTPEIRTAFGVSFRATTRMTQETPQVADTQGSETQYEGSANLLASANQTAAVPSNDSKSKASRSITDRANKIVIDKPKKKEKQSYEGPWIDCNRDRKFVDEMDQGFEKDDFMDNHNNPAPAYGRASYVEARRRKTDCNDCRDCVKCRDYYRALERQGISVNDPDFFQKNAVKNSRHTKYTPGISSQDTPPDFWECSFIDEIQERRRQDLKQQIKGTKLTNEKESKGEMEIERTGADPAKTSTELRASRDSEKTEATIQDFNSMMEDYMNDHSEVETQI